MSGSGIRWAVCKSAPRSRQITTPVPHRSSFFIGRMPLLPPNQQSQSTGGTALKVQALIKKKLYKNKHISNRTYVRWVLLSSTEQTKNKHDCIPWLGALCYGMTAFIQQCIIIRHTFCWQLWHLPTQTTCLQSVNMYYHHNTFKPIFPHLSNTYTHTHPV